MKTTHIAAIVLAVIVVGAIAGISLINKGSNNEKDIDKTEFGTITMFKSPTCGCCGVYSQYLNKRDFSVNIISIPDAELANLKNKDEIPAQLRSCHTMTIGDYFVEGHIPAEAIEKLMTEKPNIKGIAMPGMPSGSPGMPGGKTGDFVIYAVNNDGSFQEFMRV